MYLKVNNGIKHEIQGLKCWTPPVGYVIDIKTGELLHIGVYKRSEIQKDQYWERFPYPSWYKSKVKEQEEYEKKRRDDELPYYDEQLDEYIKTEWDRRLNGFWFMNNGNPVYLTGMHYVFLQWWQIDIGYPKFRYPDLEYFYFLQYCIEDPECFGMIEVCKRRWGKTFRAGLFLYEYVTRTKNANAGIQSKTGTDSSKFFAKAVVAPFKKLPKFFRPEYDTSLGITPKTAIRFQQTNIRGKSAESVLDKEELGSMIDHASADVVAYDGQKIYRYVGDETAKTIECNVYDRHNVIKYCLLDDEGKIIGKALYCTTVEKMETDKDGVQEAFKKLWDESDQNDKKENGRTVSGLYRFFMSADRGRYIDMYGNNDIPKTVEEILLERKAVEGNPRSLSQLIRKEPRTIKEAFLADGDKCLFNPMALSEQLDWLSYNEMIERGDLVWEDGHQYYKDIGDPVNRQIIIGKLKWVSSPNGEYEKVKGWFPKEPNNIFEKNGQFVPNSNYLMRIGCDPFKFDKTKSSRKSDCSSYAFQMDDPLNPDDPYNEMFVIRYSDRAATTDIQYDRVLKMAWWCSCQVLFERNVYEWKKYFRTEKCAGFLMWLPNEVEPGIYTGGNAENGVVQVIADLINSYIEKNIRKVYFKELIEEEKGWLGLRVEETQPYDDAMASGITLIAAKTKRYIRSTESGTDINSFMPIRKAG